MNQSEKLEMQLMDQCKPISLKDLQNNQIIKH